MTFSERSLVSFREAQRSLGNPARSTVYRWIDSGQIPAPVKIGGRTFWRARDLEAFIASLQAVSKGAAND